MLAMGPIDDSRTVADEQWREWKRECLQAFRDWGIIDDTDLPDVEELAIRYDKGEAPFVAMQMILAQRREDHTPS